MKQTAVEWLVNEITNRIVKRNPHDTIIIQTQGEILIELIEQAKAMEEKNLKDSFVAGAGMGEMFNNENRCYVSDAEKYLKETFKLE